MPITHIGTSHFVSFKDAVRYYKRQGVDESDVREKIKGGEIFLGAPNAKPGETVQILLSEMRYCLEIHT